MATAHESMLHCNNYRKMLNKTTRVTTRRTETVKYIIILVPIYITKAPFQRKLTDPFCLNSRHINILLL